MSRSASSGWDVVDAVGPVRAGEVLLVRVEADAAPDLLPRAFAWLSAEERARAERLRVPLAREEFVLGRACLRALLGAALGCDGRGIEFAAGDRGKPRVARPDGERIEFNVTHSRGVIVIALCRDAVVGVDIEAIDPKIEALEIGERNFAEDEKRVIASVADGDARAWVFFRLWTRKEAVVKAHGGGLLLGLDSFSVLDESDEVRVETGGGETWSVRDVAAPEGFAAALAVGQAGMDVRLEALGAAGVVRLLG